MNKLLIATNNQGKVDELQELLKDTGIELVTPAQIDLELDVLEDGLTYAENASRKALAFARASGLISLADDSGLEVDSLDGAPGLYSARYSPKPNATDKDRRTHLLQNLQDKPHPWTARFKATIAIAVPTSHVTLSRAKGLEHGQSETLWSLHSIKVTNNDEVYISEGSCEGEIISEERGSGGFGYDPIFLFPELGKTMAELSMDEKNRLSHRARAVRLAKSVLNTLLEKFG